MPGPGGPRGRGLRRPHTLLPTSSPRPGLGAEHTLTSGPCPGAANALTWTRVSQVWRDAGASSPAEKVQPSLPQSAPCPGAPNPQGTHGGWDSLRLGARMKQLTVSAPPSPGRGPLSIPNRTCSERILGNANKLCPGLPSSVSVQATAHTAHRRHTGRRGLRRSSGVPALPVASVRHQGRTGGQSEHMSRSGISTAELILSSFQSW